MANISRNNEGCTDIDADVNCGKTISQAENKRLWLLYITDLNEFSPNQRGFVVGLLNKGTYINCNPPSYKPSK